MTCGHCENAVKRALSELDGVKDVQVDLGTKKVEVEGENLVNSVLKEAIEDAGYDVLELV